MDKRWPEVDMRTLTNVDVPEETLKNRRTRTIADLRSTGEQEQTLICQRSACVYQQTPLMYQRSRGIQEQTLMCHRSICVE